MLITFVVLTAAAAAISPVVWFSWWVLADVVESWRARHTTRVVAAPRDVRAARGHRERAA